jgi:type IV secretion system protein VirD4
MQLPPDQEIVMVAGVAPIRAKKARYYADRRFQARILPPPRPQASDAVRLDDWTGLAPPAILGPVVPETMTSEQSPNAIRRDGDEEEAANSGIRQEPALPDHENIAPGPDAGISEFDFEIVERDDDPVRERRAIDGAMRRGARLASQDPDDGIEI